MITISIDRVIASKWEKTVVLLQNRTLRKFVPETERLNSQKLQRMLKRHKMVYVKPVKGGGGVGVMKINKLSNRNGIRFKLQNTTSVKRFKTFGGLYKSLQKQMKSRDYIIQKGISLLKYQNKLMDLRIMVQENLKNQWEVTGSAARIGPTKKIVTNVSSGGITVDFKKMLNHFYEDKTEQDQFLDSLHQMSLEIAKQLQKYNPNLKEIGVDIGLDDQMHPWILEVNTKPDPRIFFRDKSTIEKVVRYGRAYGRKYDLTPKFKHEKKYANKLGEIT
ncbi:YheC/YheD family protein [Chengkuizengella sediminis]|uniref:YheC/YheD family protein n=1 Tax=Chengkuizengella sediminis TaxID=1885917 RepID=UPI001389AAC6|nr:YheC/YheD family protein [Chengkuizengella sediminis]